MSLKRLLCLRERLVKQKAGFKASLKEQKRVLLKKENEVLLSTQEKMIKYLSKQISIVEKQMNEIIKENQDRKSTRLNSSHVAISYAVFCLKKKKQKTKR